jgi:Tfp pilus assembly protein PilX
MSTQSERGIALVLALFLMTALSVLGASLMFLSQTETYASLNYRMMSQARYGAEAAVQKASDFLLTNAPAPADFAACDRTVSPVTCGGNPVVLKAGTFTGVNANYPVAATQTAFDTAAQGTLTAGTATLTYRSYATLVALQIFTSYGGGTGVASTWRITADGGVQGAPKANVEILALIETPKVPASSYGAFGTYNGCAALTFGGNVQINSYDSASVSGATAPTMSNSGGNVGTNGNLTITGSADVGGNLYTPRTGVGTCSANAVDGLTEGGSAQVHGSMVQLPAEIAYPDPTLPGPSLLPAVNLSTVDAVTTCPLLGLTTGVNCFINTATKTITLTMGPPAPGVIPSLSLSSSVQLVLTANGAGTQYNFNSLQMTGGSQVGVKVTSSSDNVNVGIVGLNPDGSSIATPLQMEGTSDAVITGCATCSQYDASLLQFLYAGTGEIKETGTAKMVGTVYAPKALFTLGGTGDVYGSILANKVNETGSGNIHYDRRLLRDFYVTGHPMVGTFSWQRS